MSSFSVVSILFNPNSTGPSKQLAQELADKLHHAGLTGVELTPTEHVGHATELAYSLAMANERPLIVSSSGDGGYHEVVNGALRAQAEGRHPVCAVLAAGNANDHSRAVSTRSLDEAILSGDIETIDVLKAVHKSQDSETILYAHSYIGIGLTPAVAVELNRNQLNRIKETYIVFKTLRKLQPVEIIVDGRQIAVDSLVMANISQMAKVLVVADGVEPDDGVFQVTTFPYHQRLQLLRRLIKAATVGIRGKSATRYEFIAVKDMTIQLDGETMEMKAGDSLAVAAMVGGLATVR